MRWQTSRSYTEEMLNKPCSKSNRNHHHCAVRSPVGKSRTTLKRWALPHQTMTLLAHLLLGAGQSQLMEMS